MKLPLLRPLAAEHAIAFGRDGVVTVGRFLAEAAALAERMPACSYVLNDCADRLGFLTVLAASLLHRRTCLCAPNRMAHAWRQLAEDYRNVCCITDQGDAPAVFETVRFRAQAGAFQSTGAVSIPEIAASHVAAVTFTSGSTSRPRPLPKTWGALVGEARAGGLSLGLDAGRGGAIVAMVPAQHMYGLLTSIMMPLQWGYAVSRDKPFFPEDIRSAVEASPVPPVLVLTPVQLRACVVEKTRLPPLDFILSSAAPLPPALAREAERCFTTRVEEFFGSTETGAIARRRQCETDVWRTFEGVRVGAHPDGFLVESDYFDAVVLGDRIESLDAHQFRLVGRNADLVKIGGKRCSLTHLNQHLQEIDGVADGVFVLEDAAPGHEPRLAAFVVAPGRTRQQILAALRDRVDAVFVPRRLWLVSALPRNATGKLPRENMMQLLREQDARDASGTADCGASGSGEVVGLPRPGGR
jgi:acyl-coenzyme A synthetase/AMP-(fatty) acid ligase